MSGRATPFTSVRALGARSRRTSAETAAAFRESFHGDEVNARGDMVTVLDQVSVGDDYRYRDHATGREYTALEARALKGPKRVVPCIGGRR